MARVTSTVSGAIASFNSPGKVPINHLKVNMLPVQEGTGDPAPDNIRPISGTASLNITHSKENFGETISVTFPAFGKNLFDVEAGQNGGIMTSSGEETTTNDNFRSGYIPIEPNTAYSLSGTDISVYKIIWYTANKEFISGSLTNSMTSPSNAYFARCVISHVGTEVTKEVAKTYNIQFEQGSIATSYEPYNSTVYGGSLDICTGDLTVEWESASVRWGDIKRSDSYNSDTGFYAGSLPTVNGAKKITSSLQYGVDVFSNFTDQILWEGTSRTPGHFYFPGPSYKYAAISGNWDDDLVMQLVFKINEPFVLHLTPHQLSTFKGQNNIWSDAGNVEVNYDYAESVDILKIRRQMMMNHLVEPDGWQYKRFVAASDTTNGLTTISAIQNELPNKYRYAVALKRNPSNPYNNAFLGAIFLPTRSGVLGLRYRNGVYEQRADINNTTYDVELMTGEVVDIFWRHKPLGNDAPPTTWDYSVIQPGAITRADALKTALTNGIPWTSKLAVSDLDFKKIPALNRTYCESVTMDSSNMTGAYIRTNDLAYQSVNSWTSAYDCQVEESTSIINFSFTAIGEFTKEYYAVLKPNAANSFVINHNLGITPRFCMIRLVDSTLVKTNAYITECMMDFNVQGMDQDKTGIAYFRFYYDATWQACWKPLPYPSIIEYSESIINVIGYPYGTSRSQWDQNADYIVQIWG